MDDKSNDGNISVEDIEDDIMDTDDIMHTDDPCKYLIHWTIQWSWRIWAGPFEAPGDYFL